MKKNQALIGVNNNVLKTFILQKNVLCCTLVFLTRILQLQQLVVDVQSKLNHEKKEREVDETDLNKR